MAEAADQHHRLAQYLRGLLPWRRASGSRFAAGALASAGGGLSRAASARFAGWPGGVIFFMFATVGA
jgi:fatty acid desaturase